MHGHRGARGLAPENTWPAFEAAIRTGMTAIELDVHLTADSEIIIHHDPYTNPGQCTKRDGKRIGRVRIARMLAAELKTFDCGAQTDHKFPGQIASPGALLLTLRDFFVTLREFESIDQRAAQVKINIDVKFPPGKPPSEPELTHFARLIFETVQKANMGTRVMVQSFEKRMSPVMKQAAPEIPTAVLFPRKHWSSGHEQWSKHMIKTALEMQANIVAPYRRDTNAQLIKLAHAKGLKVIAWTINDPDEMRGLIRMGIDGIISDYPDRLKSAADSERQRSLL